ncbi:MAG: hypothetical protein QOH49_151 [Acidobacteriota bacterium]|jgi:class 3 adenylate cyclase|nr:hypothetical protein [Acidobacteriota bacterium]
MVKFWKDSPPAKRNVLNSSQLPEQYLSVIEKQIAEFKDGVDVITVSEIPDTNSIPLDASRWLKIQDLICVFVDMKNSTKLSAVTHDRSTAKAYQFFTGTAVRLFDAFEAPYIDVRGDGVFGMFNRNQVYRALAAAVSFKTFATKVFAPTMKDKTGLDLGAHIGVDQKTVLVRRLGLRRISQRTDRQNEVWAGKPVNMAAKLAAIGEADDLLVSCRYYDRITDEHARKSCGCPNGTKTDLWNSIDVSANPIFDFDTAWRLGSCWCHTHGAEFCNRLLTLDKD